MTEIEKWAEIAESTAALLVQALEKLAASEERERCFQARVARLERAVLGALACRTNKAHGGVGVVCDSCAESSCAALAPTEAAP